MNRKRRPFLFLAVLALPVFCQGRTLDLKTRRTSPLPLTLDGTARSLAWESRQGPNSVRWASGPGLPPRAGLRSRRLSYTRSGPYRGPKRAKDMGGLRGTTWEAFAAGSLAAPWDAVEGSAAARGPWEFYGNGRRLSR